MCIITPYTVTAFAATKKKAAKTGLPFKPRAFMAFFPPPGLHGGRDCPILAGVRACVKQELQIKNDTNHEQNQHVNTPHWRGLPGGPAAPELICRG
jgi:hypothetical protein